jgi:hypothetical protein
MILDEQRFNNLVFEFLKEEVAIARKGYSEELERLNIYFKSLKEENSVENKSLEVNRKLVFYPFTLKDIEHMTSED